MKSGTESLLKFQYLNDDFALGHWATVGVLQSLWMFATKNCPDGAIGRFSNHDIAYALGWNCVPPDPHPLGRICPDKCKSDAAEWLMHCLIKRRWVDAHAEPDIRLLVHDWPIHCETTVHRKLARARWYFACGAEPKTSGLGKVERAEADRWYASNRKRAHGVGMPGALSGGPTDTVPLPVPCPANPSPSRAKPGGGGLLPVVEMLGLHYEGKIQDAGWGVWIYRSRDERGLLATVRTLRACAEAGWNAPMRAGDEIIPERLVCGEDVAPDDVRQPYGAEAGKCDLCGCEVITHVYPDATGLPVAGCWVCGNPVALAPA